MKRSVYVGLLILGVAAVVAVSAGCGPKPAASREAVSPPQVPAEPPAASARPVQPEASPAEKPPAADRLERKPPPEPVKAGPSPAKPAPPKKPRPQLPKPPASRAAAPRPSAPAKPLSPPATEPVPTKPAPTVDARPKPEGTVVIGAIEVASNVPDPTSVPYDTCVTFIKYRVTKVVSGSYNGEELLAVFWGMKKGKLQPAARFTVGQTHRLTIEPFSDHKDLARVMQADDTGEYSLTPYWVISYSEE